MKPIKYTDIMKNKKLEEFEKDEQPKKPHKKAIGRKNCDPEPGRGKQQE